MQVSGTFESHRAFQPSQQHFWKMLFACSTTSEMNKTKVLGDLKAGKALSHPGVSSTLQSPPISANWLVPGRRTSPADLGQLGLVVLHLFPAPSQLSRLRGKAELHCNPASSCRLNAHRELNAHLCNFQLSSAFFW